MALKLVVFVDLPTSDAYIVFICIFTKIHSLNNLQEQKVIVLLINKFIPLKLADIRPVIKKIGQLLIKCNRYFLLAFEFSHCLKHIWNLFGDFLKI